MIVNIAAKLLGSVIGIWGEKGKAKQEALATRVEAMKRSWTDEFIAVYWFSPSIVSWFDPDKATAMITSMTSNEQFFGVQIGITLAVFGIGKLNGKK